MATTNGVGRFELRGISGPVTLVASAPGYLDLRVPDVQPQTPLTIELERAPNFMETVQVTATKSGLSVGDVAAPTTIVDRDAIEPLFCDHGAFGMGAANLQKTAGTVIAATFRINGGRCIQ